MIDTLYHCTPSERYTTKQKPPYVNDHGFKMVFFLYPIFYTTVMYKIQESLALIDKSYYNIRNNLCNYAAAL